MDEKTAQKIVNALLSELEGRGGFDILNLIHDDTETYNEMYETCVGEVQKASKSDMDPRESRWHPDCE